VLWTSWKTLDLIKGRLVIIIVKLGSSLILHAWHINTLHFIKHVVFSNASIMSSIHGNRCWLLLGPDKFFLKEFHYQYGKAYNIKELDKIGDEAFKLANILATDKSPSVAERGRYALNDLKK
jgi:hypothetical protein